jgi:hypothetical protein
MNFLEKKACGRQDGGDLIEVGGGWCLRAGGNDTLRWRGPCDPSQRFPHR